MGVARFVCFLLFFFLRVSEKGLGFQVFDRTTPWFRVVVKGLGFQENLGKSTGGRLISGGLGGHFRHMVLYFSNPFKVGPLKPLSEGSKFISYLLKTQLFSTFWG